MCRHRDGDPRAFSVLVERHRDRAFRFLRRMGLPRVRAEEVLADVFLKIHVAAPRYQPQAKFTTFLFTVASRAAINARERHLHQRDIGVGGDAELERAAGDTAGVRGGGAAGRNAAGAPDSAGSRDPEQALSVKRAMAALERELREIPEGHRVALLLYYDEGLSCAEIAAALEITAAEAKGRLAYARRLLRERLWDVLEGGEGL
jgi:RNA polymerase sigma-70 factor (ECF subfamily)